MPVVSGPCQVEIGTGGTMLTIAREDQFEDATLSIARMIFELKTQLSDSPTDYRKTGIDVGLSLSIANSSSLKLIALAFNTNVLGTSPNEYIALKDDAGKEFTRQKVVIKPYNGDALSSATNWWTFPSAAAVTDEAFEQAFGLTTQRAFTLRLMGLANPTTDATANIKAYYGPVPAV